MAAAFAAGTYGARYDCHVCQKDPEARIRWGCQTPTEHPQLHIPCQFCTHPPSPSPMGEDTQPPRCETCSDTGSQPIHHCPAHALRAIGPEFLDAWSFLHQFHQLPAPGGIDNQAGIFIQAILFAQRETNEQLAEKYEN